MDFKYTKQFWSYVLKIKNTEFCICVVCGKRYKANVGNGKAIKNHVYIVHKFQEIDSKINKEDLDKEFFKFMVYSNVSTTILDSPELRKFLYKLNYILPRRSVYNEYLAETANDIKVYILYIFVYRLIYKNN